MVNQHAIDGGNELNYKDFVSIFTYQNTKNEESLPTEFQPENKECLTEGRE